MAKLPIRYAKEIPPAQGTNVRASMTTDTGEGAIWGAVAGLGQAAAGLGLDMLAKIKRADDALAESDTQLKMDDLRSAFRQTAMTTDDPQAMAAAAQKYESDTMELAKTTGAKLYANRSIADTREFAVKLGVDRKIKELRDTFEIQSGRFLASGNVDDYKKLLPAMVTNGIMTKAEASERIATAPFDAGIAQARMTAEHDPDMALKLIEPLKPANETQAKARESAMSHVGNIINARRMDSKSLSDKSIGDMYVQMDKAKGLSAAERNVLADQFSATVAKATGMRAPDYIKGDLEHIEAFRRGEQAKGDAMVEREAWDRVLSLDENSTKAEQDAANRFLIDNAPKLGSAYVTLGKAFDESKKSAAQNSLKASIDIAVSNLQVAPDEQASFTRLIVAKTKQQKLDNAGVASLVAQEAVTWQAAHSKPKTVTKGDVVLDAVIAHHEKELARYDALYKARGLADKGMDYKIALDMTSIDASTGYAPPDVTTETMTLEKFYRVRNALADLLAIEKKKRDTGAATPATVPSITSDAERNALPPGAEYIGPDGKRRRKP